MVERLRLRAPHHDWEPAHSVAARLATRHEEPLPRFLRGLGLNLRELASGHQVDRLAALACCDAGALVACTARPGGVGQGVQLGGEILSWVDWSISPRRVCPACLFDDRKASDTVGLPWSAWHRAWWDVQAIEICPAHGCHLLNQCWDCGEMLDWSGLAIDRCPQGHLLSRSTAADWLDVAVDAYLQGRFSPSAACYDNPFLDTLSIGNAARVIERLGAIEQAGWTASFPEAVDSHVRARRRQAGFLISRDIERRFRDVLDRVVDQAPIGARGLITSYGWVYRTWLGVPGVDQSGGHLRSILLAHAADHGIISDQELAEASNTVAMKDAAVALGKGHASTRNVLGAAGLVPAGSRPGVAFRIDAEEVGRLQSHLADLMDSQTAAKFLGIGRGQFRALVQQRLVNEDEKAERLGCGRLFARGDLRRFLTKLTSGVPLVTRTPSRTLALPTACRVAGVPLAKVCRAIIEGKIAPVARSADEGLSAIKVLPADLGALRAARPRPVETVARALGVHLQAASELVKAGAFGVPPDVSARSLAAFGRRYAKPADLAALLGGSGRSVIRRLADAGLHPAFGPPNCRQLFYARQPAATVFGASISNTVQ